MKFQTLVSAFVFTLFSLNCYAADGEIEFIKPESSEKVQKPSPESNIEFFNKGAKIILAELEVPDPLQVCPIETSPDGIAILIDRVIKDARSEVSAMQLAGQEKCNLLKSRMTFTQEQIDAALSRPFIASDPANIENLDQAKINADTQKASPVFNFAKDLNEIYHECVPSTDKRAVVQKLLGQVISAGGSFSGGWQGTTANVAGQIISNLPLFHTEEEEALKYFQNYEKEEHRSAFLCRYRDMQKTSCLLFPPKNRKIVGGIDITLASGPGETTQKSMERIQSKSPDLLEDLRMLWKISETGLDFLIYQKTTESNPQMGSSVEHFQKFCDSFNNSQEEEKGSLDSDFQLQALRKADIHPAAVVTALTNIQQKCQEFQIPREYHKKQLGRELFKVSQNLMWLRNYYLRIRNDNKNPLGYVARTWESFLYFKNLKKNWEQFESLTSGSVKRLNFLTNVENIGEHIGRKSLKPMFRSFRKRLVQHQIRDRFFPTQSAESFQVRQRAIFAMLDLCQTFDPTLVCLSPGEPQKHRFFDQWAKRCVGKKSTLCKSAALQRDLKELISLEEHKTYFNSLCGDDPQLALPVAKK